MQQQHMHAQQQHQQMMAQHPMQHMMQHPHQQQQQMMMMQQQQQQQMMMMQQQQQHQMMMQQQAMQQQKLQQAQQQSTKAETAQAEGDNYTEEGYAKPASMEEMAAAWACVQAETEEQQEQETLEDYLANEGMVNGASMEELAAAWAEAQDAHYDTPNTTVEGEWHDPNMAAAYHAPIETYTFQNKVSEEQTSIPREENPQNFMQEGMKHFQDGNIAKAIQQFEMELQVNDPDNATAWRMLGRCHAENDQDREAILCLETAVERDPFSPESQLALGVSYVNELNHSKALAALKSWITMNPKYAGLEIDHLGEDLYGDAASRMKNSTTQSGSDSTDDNNYSEFQDVQNLLLQALEYDASDAADVWEALGVAANVTRDFETAIEAFHNAIEARPNDYQLWNKLGATLANGNQSDKALPAYHKALQIKPKYARAWLNMAISHSNLQNFDEAARCYLQTLSLNPGAVHCWSYLRVALSCSERWDLVPFAASQNLDAFKEHFDFVAYDRAA